MALSNEQIKSYERNGYVLVPNLFSATEVGRLRELVYRLWRKFQPNDTSLDLIDSPWNDPEFDQKMIALRASDRRTFGALYDSAQSAVDVVQVVAESRVAEIAADCLGDGAENLSYSGIMFRMDPPQDRRNLINWHQDRAYYPQNLDGNNGLVITVALQDITADTGAIVFAPGSHCHGFIEPIVVDKPNYETTEQRGIPPEIVNKYGEEYAEMKAGDLGVMHMNLFHRSGDNTGSRIRYTALCRFHRIMANDYVPFGLLYQFNDLLAEMIWPKRKGA